MKILHFVAFFTLGVLSHHMIARASQPFVHPMFGVNVTTDVQYGSSLTGNGANLPRFLDVYEPTGPGLPVDLPAIVLMHGGFFTSGDKSDAATYANAFASRGYVAVSINYRLLLADNLPDPPGNPISLVPSRYPSWLLPDLASLGVTVEEYFAEIAAAVADQGMAVNWLADNAGTYNLDPNKIAVGGFSAGAVSSLMLGAGVVDGVQADVGAVLSLAGGLLGQEPFIDANDPGVYIVHGDQDTIVPFAEVGFLETALTGAGVPFESQIFAGAGHSPFETEILIDNPDPMFEFLIEQLNVHAVPEPSTLLLGALATAGLLMRRKRVS